jgi:hypothetical protein
MPVRLLPIGATYWPGTGGLAGGFAGAGMTGFLLVLIMFLFLSLGSILTFGACTTPLCCPPSPRYSASRRQGVARLAQGPVHLATSTAWPLALPLSGGTSPWKTLSDRKC